MAWSVIASTAQAPGSGVATTGIDTTGADLVIVLVGGGTTNTLADNKSNTWATADTWNDINASGFGLRIFYAYQAQGSFAVGSGHTFTVTGSIPSIDVIAVSGALTSADPLHTQAHASTTGTTTQPGSVTPNADNDLAVVGWSGQSSNVGAPGDNTISVGYTIASRTEYLSGTALSRALAYKTDPSGAQNPTCTVSTNLASGIGSSIAIFKQAGAGGGGGGGTTEVASLRRVDAMKAIRAGRVARSSRFRRPA